MTETAALVVEGGMSLLPALPEPAAVELARVRHVVEQLAVARAEVEEKEDLAAAVELHRYALALERFQRDREARALVGTEARWDEYLIGKLLGPAENLGPATFSDGKGSAIPPKARHEFRALAWWPDGTPIAREDVESKISPTRSRVKRGLRTLWLLRQAREAVPPATEAAADSEDAPVRVSEGVHLATVEEAAKLLDPQSVDVVVTDPPYNAEGVGGYVALRDFASSVLRPGGSLIAMVGQYHLPLAINALLGGELRYHWMCAYLTPGGQAPQIFQRRVNTFWKPLLWLVKGDYDGAWVGDVLRSDVNDNDKRQHKWGQSESGMADVIGRFTLDGELVCDPYCGGGTTGVVAVRLGRRFVGFDRDADQVAIARGRLAS